MLSSFFGKAEMNGSANSENSVFKGSRWNGLILCFEYLDRGHRSRPDLAFHLDYPSSLDVAVLPVYSMTSCPYVDVGQGFLGSILVPKVIPNRISGQGCPRLQKVGPLL